MKLLLRALDELLSLFVDDVPAAAAIVVWIGLGHLVLGQLPRGTGGLALFAGLLLLVAASIRRNPK